MRSHTIVISRMKLLGSCFNSNAISVY